jgi:type I restriction enzyme S subunit
MIHTNINKAGYKHTPLGWIPEDWEIKEFGEIVTNSQYGLSNASANGGNYKIIGMKNIQGGKLVIDNCGMVSLTNEEFAKHKLVPDDFLFNRTNSYDLVGKSVLIETDPDATFASYLIRFKLDKEKVLPKFVYYFFNTDKSGKKLKVIATKAVSQANINPTVLQNVFELLVPPLPEQSKIAAILCTWDEAITKTQHLIAQLQQRNKGLMQHLLKPTKNWKEIILSNVFERVVRKNTEGNKTVVTISAQRGFVKQEEFFKKLVASDITDNYFLVHRGEFCYNKSYSKGYDWGATKRLNDFDKAVVTTLYICFRIKDESQYSGKYFEYFFDANVLDKGLSKIAHEGGRAHGLLNVTPTDFFSLKINVPSYIEQLKIASVLSTAKNELNIQEQKLAALQQQKKGLMQKLLTGEVRVNV